MTRPAARELRADRSRRSVRGRGGERRAARRADRPARARRGRGPRVRLVPGRRRAGPRAGCHRDRGPGRRPGRLPALDRARSRRPGPVPGDAAAAAAGAGRPGAPVRRPSARRGRARRADRGRGRLPGRRADQRGGRDRARTTGSASRCWSGTTSTSPAGPRSPGRTGRRRGTRPGSPTSPTCTRPGCGRWPGTPIPAWPRGCTRPCPARTTRRPRRSACSPPSARTWSACPPCWRRSPPATSARRCWPSRWSPTPRPGLAAHGLDHAEVVAAGQAAADRMGALLAQVLPRTT